ncbi:MAG: N-acetylmuramidase [Agarilytica sp.]
MADIDKLIQDVLRREGGFVNHPADRGGPTNFGITQKTLSQYMGRAALISDVENMAPDLAAEIYRQNYYFRPAINTLPEAIQAFIFDSAVNHGPRRAIKFIQLVVNDAGYEPRLDDDGAMGPNTRRGAEWAQNTMGEHFLLALFEERKNFYRVIVANRPSQEVFLKGWMNRVKEFEDAFEGVVA